MSEKNDTEIIWMDDAQARLQMVPVFVRVIVKKTVEKYAKQNGYDKINTEIWEEAKKAKGRF